MSSDRPGLFGDTRAVLRGLAALGATFAVLATFFPWYVFEVVLPAGGVTHAFAVPITLWDLTTLAPIIIVAAAVVALVCLAMIDSRVAGVVEALVGLGITVYAVVRCFDVPALGVDALPAAVPRGGGRAATQLAGGTFVGMAGGLMLLVGSLADLLPEREAQATPAPGAQRAPAPPATERAPDGDQAPDAAHRA